jgi:hypothetical protein
MKKGERIEITKGTRLGTTGKFARKGDKGTYIGSGSYARSIIKLDKVDEKYEIHNYYFCKLREEHR